MWSLFSVECATKNSEARCDIALQPMPLYSPTSATVALTTGGVSLIICKNILFCFCIDTPPVVTPTVAAVGVSSHGLYHSVTITTHNALLSFW